MNALVMVPALSDIRTVAQAKTDLPLQYHYMELPSVFAKVASQEVIVPCLHVVMTALEIRYAETASATVPQGRVESIAHALSVSATAMGTASVWTQERVVARMATGANTARSRRARHHVPSLTAEKSQVSAKATNAGARRATLVWIVRRRHVVSNAIKARVMVLTDSVIASLVLVASTAASSLLDARTSAAGAESALRQRSSPSIVIAKKDSLVLLVRSKSVPQVCSTSMPTKRTKKL